MVRQKTRKVLRLRALRREREMSQTDLGRRVGLRTASICDIEKGRQQPSLKTARDLAAVFGVPVEQLFDYVEVPAS